jgi:predicted nucleic acid-binding protein
VAAIHSKTTSSALVLECSVTLAWFFVDEQAEYPQAVLDSLDSVKAFVPAVWPLEVANALLVGERRKRCTQAQTTTWLGLLKSLPISIDDEPVERSWDNALALARSHQLSVYDATYLELALRRGLHLATLDDKLRAAATNIGVPLH